ncbi:MAG: hypothetical protein ACREOB_00735, partial [Thermodesulfobacteriota bacterium]
MRDFNLDFLNIFSYGLIVFACMFSFGCSKSYATREFSDSTLEIARNSEHIVVAKCISSKSNWDENQRFIFTYTTFSVEEVVKGETVGDDITLRIIGGQVGNTKVDVPDRPEFLQDEEVILFLGPKNADGYPTLSSLKKGVLRLELNEISGEKVVATPVTGIKILRKDSESPAPSESGVLLEDLVYSLKR